MNVQAQNVRDLALAVFKEEHSKANGDGVKSRLMAVRDACEDIVSRRGTPNPPSVVAWLANNRPNIKLSTRTIYNHRALPDGTTVESPYAKIIAAWAAITDETARAKRVRTPEASCVAEASFLSSKDLASIDDLVVRHKVAIVLGQFNQLKNQADMRKAIRETPPVPRFLETKDEPAAIAFDVQLNEDEIEALSDFLKESSVKRRGLQFNDIGSVVAGRVVTGSALSRPGFVDALRKILVSYGVEGVD